MLKKPFLFPALALVGGVVAFFLRLAQNRTGFESGTGLPIPGNPWGMALVVWLVLTGACCCVLVQKLPPETAGCPASFGDAFSTSDAARLTVLVAGLFLLALSGLGEAAAGLGLLPQAATGAIPSLSGRGLLLQGALTAAAAACLFPAISVCRRSGAREAAPVEKQSLNGNLLLAPVGCLVIRLVLTYRVDSVNPSLSVYYAELLAQVFLALAFYRLSSFAFQAGRTRRFVLYALPAVVLCLTTLADSRAFYTALFYAGSALVLLAFLLLRLEASALSAENS